MKSRKEPKPKTGFCGLVIRCLVLGWIANPRERGYASNPIYILNKVSSANLKAKFLISSIEKLPPLLITSFFILVHLDWSLILSRNSWPCHVNLKGITS